MARGKPEIDRERCTGCELCLGACPEKILKMSESFNLAGVYYSVCFDEARCTACLSCAIICPECAIKIWRATAA